MTIGQKIEARKKQLNLSLQDIADYCGVAKTTVHYWINDDTKRLKLPQIRLLANLLKVDMKSLMYDDEDMKPVDVIVPVDELEKELFLLVSALPLKDKVELYSKLSKNNG